MAMVARGRWLLLLSHWGLSPYKAPFPPSLWAPCYRATCQALHRSGFALHVARSSQNMGLGSPHGCPCVPASSWVLGKLR